MSAKAQGAKRYKEIQKDETPLYKRGVLCYTLKRGDDNEDNLSRSGRLFDRTIVGSCVESSLHEAKRNRDASVSTIIKISDKFFS